MEPKPVDSPLETRRYGRRIARLRLTGTEDAAEVRGRSVTGGHDLVVASFPTDAPLHPGQLNAPPVTVSLVEVSTT